MKWYQEYRIGESRLRYCLDVDKDNQRICLTKEYFNDVSNKWYTSAFDDNRFYIPFGELVPLGKLFKKAIGLLNLI